MDGSTMRGDTGGFAPPAGRASGPVGVVQAADREIARLTAVRGRALAEFARSRPASADRQPGEPGAMSAVRRAARPAVLADVSEWAASELSIGSSISKQAPQQRLERSLLLVDRLPGTVAALESGLLHDGHLFPMLERVAVVADGARRAELERDVLAWVAARAARRQITTPAQLTDRLRRTGLGRDPKQEADDLLAALNDRGVWVRPDRRAGMGVLQALLTVPEAQAVVDSLGRHADALDDPADPRTRGQKMADVLLDMVLRPGKAGLPPVQAQLTLVAGVRTALGGGAPGEISGQPVPAELVRAVARALGLLGGPGTAPAPEPAAEPAAEPNVVATVVGAPEEAWPARLREKWERAVAADTARALAGVWGGCLDEPPPEVQQRLWDEEGQWDEEFERIVGPPPEDTAETGTDAVPADSSWAAAHAAVEAAGLALLSFQQAVGRASAVVGNAWRADQREEDAWREGTGRFDAASSDLEALRLASEAQREELAGLLDRTGGGTLVDRPRIALVDELTGTLLALTDARELRRLTQCGRPACRRRPQTCDHDLTGRPGLRPPPASEGHDPGAALDRYLRARDRTCRFPGCRRRTCELDHKVPWPDGPTSAENLEGFCTGDHRGKHQAPGWTYGLTADGTVTVTTPTGLTATTDPPPF
ncbi:HNH endonuclease signature motif containing protein [Blastococcus sp. PRF04-17]|uniref:HNH endonuclease signature motif containing protein n=1 Tax=Blastococcus sp. PRF04-17 TaxID=2933797 RepID=UPI001FF5F162|nr:HNH endonuclease signature motif containing protein [Blastococcus sp. PRF04-17]UOY02849.1 HNH endonuclease [Blastococcus sp. PRF04-17]